MQAVLTSPRNSSGIFGLNNQPVNFTTLGNHSQSSFITSLKDRGMIPSLSWSYTAGAKYRKSLNPNSSISLECVR